MRALIVLLAGLAGSAHAQEQETRTRLHLELELAKAKAPAKPIAAEAPAHVDYGTAYRDCRASGKPLFASVAADCTGLCPTLRPEFLTAHLTEIVGDKRPHYVLMAPRGGQVLKVKEWAEKPTDNAVRAAYREFARPVIAAPAVLDWTQGT